MLSFSFYFTAATGMAGKVLGAYIIQETGTQTIQDSPTNPGKFVTWERAQDLFSTQAKPVICYVCMCPWLCVLFHL